MTAPITTVIADALGRRGWTQADLAQHAGISKNTMSAIMTGRVQPRPDTLHRIRRALDLDPAPAGPLLSEASDADLLAELAQRLRTREHDVAQLRAALAHGSIGNN